MYIYGGEFGNIQLKTYDGVTAGWKDITTPDIYLQGGHNYTLALQGWESCAPECCYDPEITWDTNANGPLYQLWGCADWESGEQNQYSNDYSSSSNTTLKLDAATNEQPANNTPSTSIHEKSLNVTTVAAEPSQMTVYFYFNNEILDSKTVNSGEVASLYLPDYITPSRLVHNAIYEWYVIVDDGADTYTGPTWNFRTSRAWDIDESGIVNIIDVSGMAAAYGDSGPPGDLAADVNEDGIVDAADASVLLAHYGEIST
jgi:hypothetical protein